MCNVMCEQELQGKYACSAYLEALEKMERYCGCVLVC